MNTYFDSFDCQEQCEEFEEWYKEYSRELTDEEFAELIESLPE